MAKKAAKTARKRMAFSRSLKKLSASMLSSVKVSAATTTVTRSVTFSEVNGNVKVQVKALSESGTVPCTLKLPVGIFPLFYKAVGAGPFHVTVSGAELSHPIKGTAPKDGLPLIKVV